MREKSDKGIEQRLDVLTGLRRPAAVKDGMLKGRRFWHIRSRQDQAF